MLLTGKTSGQGREFRAPLARNPALRWTSPGLPSNRLQLVPVHQEQHQGFNVSPVTCMLVGLALRVYLPQSFQQRGSFRRPDAKRTPPPDSSFIDSLRGAGGGNVECSAGAEAGGPPGLSSETRRSSFVYLAFPSQPQPILPQNLKGQNNNGVLSSWLMTNDTFRRRKLGE